MTALLNKVRETIPAATIAQLEDILNTIGSTPESVMSKPGKIQSFLAMVQKAQPGGLAPVETPAPIAPVPTPAPTEAPKAPIVPSEGGDRDWSKFNIRDLATLSMAELKEFKAWRAEEAERKALMNEILGEEADAIAAEEEALKNRLTIDETNRRILKAKAQVEFMEQKGSDLDKLSLETGKELAADYLERETKAFKSVLDLGKQTPTEGELAHLQAQVVNRSRMNRANTIANSIAPLVKAIGGAEEQNVQTIDV
jgi:hypothetical protein